jgi:hypothetical protein
MARCHREDLPSEFPPTAVEQWRVGHREDLPSEFPPTVVEQWRAVTRG